MKPIRMGMIGLGHIPQNAHLPALSQLVEKGKVVLQAFCDVDRGIVSEQAKVWGAKSVYTDHRRCSTKRIGGVMCVCPEFNGC